jgi:hypothetical protein
VTSEDSALSGNAKPPTGAKPSLAALSVLAAVLSAVAAIVSALLAYQSNVKADHANALAAEANRIALQRMQIVLQDSGPDVRAIRGTGTVPIFMYGCHSQISATLRIYSFTDTSVTFSNLGGRSVSLIDAQLSGGDRQWELRAYQLSGPIVLPIDIEPGTSRRWDFTALSTLTDSSQSSIRLKWDKLRYAAPVLEWTFFFGDGTTLVWETQAYTSSPTVDPDFSTTCAALDAADWY